MAQTRDVTRYLLLLLKIIITYIIIVCTTLLLLLLLLLILILALGHGEKTVLLVEYRRHQGIEQVIGVVRVLFPQFRLRLVQRNIRILVVEILLLLLHL